MRNSRNSNGIFGPPSRTRLVTIAAHVDHGKTTLADNLIERNGLISERAAGTLRYLDSDPEEQRRGITMRSSAIGIKHTYRPPPGAVTQPSKNDDHNNNMIVHLLDSPGHSDFSREVSSAMVACDAAILVVDAVEGMGARTQQVFRETAAYQLTPLLVVNKIDRLATELCLTPTEAYVRLRSLLESVNAAAAAMIQHAAAAVAEGSRTRGDDGVADDNAANDLEAQEALWTFDPAKGNVIFASALFGWGFTVQSLCRSLFRAKAVRIKPPLLRTYMFGDYKLKDQEKVLKWKQTSDDVPLFAEFALQPIWDIYEGVAMAAATIGIASQAPGSAASSNNNNSGVASKTDVRIRADTLGMDRVLEALQMGDTNTPQHQASAIRSSDDLQTVLTRTGSGSSADAALRAILRRYRPLSDAVLDAVCHYCPSPAKASAETRSQALALKDPPSDSSTSDAFDRIRRAVATCDDAPDAPAVAHVCKFLSTDLLHVKDPVLGAAAEEESSSRNLILGLARVLSGRLTTGQAYHVFGPKHGQNADGTESATELPMRKIRLYLLMGSSFLHVEEVPAGHLCAIYGLEDVQLKTVTLSDSGNCQPLRGFHEGVKPLVKVSIEPELTADAEFLERGLVKLGLADAAVEISATEKGERILACLGELHLEQSVLDLENVYCEKEGLKIRISDPIVDFAETTVWFENAEVENYTSFFDSSLPPLRQTALPPYNEEEGISQAKFGRTRAIVSGRSAAISLRVVPLTDGVYEALRARSTVDIDADTKTELVKIGHALNCHARTELSPESVAQTLLNLLCSVGPNSCGMVESIGFHDGTSVLGVEASEVYVPLSHSSESNPSDEDAQPLNSDDDGNGYGEYTQLRERIRTGAFDVSKDARGVPTTELDSAAKEIWLSTMKGSVVAGFESALRAGPICEEPMRNILVIVEGVEIAVVKTSSREDETFKPSKSLVGGMVVSALRSGIRCALLSRPARLMEGHLRLTLHSSLAGLGSLYQVLSKRRGKVVEDSMVDGTDLLMITAMIPQAEAFGLTPELFAKTSGEVTAPGMMFSHWDRLDVDPFWIPTSEEEREDFGELQSAGDSSTGIDNTALSYIRKVRKRKGLVVDSSRTVLNAEKQRTLKR